jgi:hypothetical protein
MRAQTRVKNDMSIDIDDDDCIVVDTKGGEVTLLFDFVTDKVITYIIQKHRSC